jgi:hypothetical protein
MLIAAFSAIQHKMKTINQKITSAPEENEVNWPVVIGIIAGMVIIVLLLNFA